MNTPTLAQTLIARGLDLTTGLPLSPDDLRALADYAESAEWCEEHEVGYWRVCPMCRYQQEEYYESQATRYTD